MKKNLGMLALIMAFWFTISFITNILGPLIPDIIHNFNLSDLAMAGFIPTSFFLAYAIMSIPAGLLIDRFGEKPVLFGGFLMPFIGTILFACMHTYPMLLASSFIIGLGMAMLQTVLNPLQRTVGGEENYAFIAELAQFMFGIASFLSPLVYTYLIRELDPATYTAGKGFFIDLLADVTPREMPWVSLYWVFTILLLVMLIAVGVSRFPKIELKEDEKSGSKDSYLALSKDYDKEQCISALEEAGLRELFEKRGYTLDTYFGKDMGEDGIELSGGQKQKFLLARALYKPGTHVYQVQ